MFFSAVLFRGFIAELQSRGFNAEHAAAVLGVRGLDLTDVRLRLTMSEADRIVMRAIRATGDPGLGLVMGNNAPDTMLNMLGTLLLSARSLRHAFELFTRYVPLLAEGLDWRLAEEGDSAMFIQRCTEPNAASSRFVAEYVAATAMRVGRKLLPERSAGPLRATFQHPRPDYAERYEPVFQCPIAFGSEFNALVCDRRLLDVPHPYADAAVHGLVLDLAENTLRQLDTRPRSLAERISMMLLHDIHAAAMSARELAERIKMTPRQLRRRLALEGTTISDLLERAKSQHAQVELKHGGSIEAVATRLGFSERSAFHRAFKRWTDQTPQQFIHEHRHRSWS